MRPLEALLLLADLLAFLALAVPRLRVLGLAGYLVVAAVLAAAAHLVVERYRWQMVPAYALTAVLLLAWLAQRAAPAGWGVPGLVAGAAVALGALGLLVAAALPVIVPAFRFPRPSGPHAIGTVTYHWVDEGRQELFTDDPDDRRELVAQVWYPAVDDPSAPRAPYLQDAGALTTWIAWLLHVRVPGFLSGGLTSVTTNAVAGAPATAEPGGFPVVVFVEGLSAFRQMNTYQVEELVSHGYVVVGVDQPYVAASVALPGGRRVVGLPKAEIWPLVQPSLGPAEDPPDQRGRAFPNGIVPYLAQDVVFALDRVAELNASDPQGVLTGRLDMDRVGVMSISMGAVLAPEACRVDPRFRACLFIEAPVPADVVADGLEQPSLLLISDAETMRRAGWSRADIDQHQGTMRALYEALRGGGYWVQVHGTYHLNLTDAPLLLGLPLRALGLLGPIRVSEAHDIVDAYTVAFFDRHLKGLPAPLLDGSSPYPEVTFESRGPLAR